MARKPPVRPRRVRSKPDDPALLARATEGARAGLTNELLASHCGMARSTYQEWMRRGAAREAGFVAFLEAVRAGESEGARMHLDVIRKVATGKRPNWAASAWLLERRYGYRRGGEVSVAAPESTPPVTSPVLAAVGGGGPEADLGGIGRDGWASEEDEDPVVELERELVTLRGLRAAAWAAGNYKGATEITPSIRKAREALREARAEVEEAVDDDTLITRIIDDTRALTPDEKARLVAALTDSTNREEEG